ncbi:MAG TPA: ABC transporter substrate-binding protein, partial [Thermoanaerobaculia bacterium]|nr:ABC transporter substrate-binding protein [Thermoanaerobaculia bacterium]
MFRLRLLAAASLLLLTCAPAERAAAPVDPGISDTEIIIGSWGPLSGPAALWGSVLRGMETY